MKIWIASPEPARSPKGNAVTAGRWARILRGLGHEVRLGPPDRRRRPGERELLIALHARRSHGAVRAWRADRPQAPLVVALTGTDLYEDLPDSPEASESLRLADRLVVLHPGAVADLPAEVRPKARVILQSVRAPRRLRRPVSVAEDAFEVGVLANLRAVKDPLLAAAAARLLAPESRVRILHAGLVIDPALGRAAAAERRSNPRYEWLGALPRARALWLLSGCRALVLSSRSEGGANVVGEAVALGVPVLGTRISGTTGLLGDDYPGLFEVGDARALADLLERVEDPASGLLEQLRTRCAARRASFAPEPEAAAWRELLNGLSEGGP